MGICLATAFVQESGVQSSEPETDELASVRGTDATERADLWATLFVEREAGVKAAALLMPAIRSAIDNLILLQFSYLVLFSSSDVFSLHDEECWRNVGSVVTLVMSAYS